MTNRWNVPYRDANKKIKYEAFHDGLSDSIHDLTNDEVPWRPKDLVQLSVWHLTRYPWPLAYEFFVIVIYICGYEVDIM